MWFFLLFCREEKLLEIQIEVKKREKLFRQSSRKVGKVTEECLMSISFLWRPFSFSFTNFILFSLKILQTRIIFENFFSSAWKWVVADGRWGKSPWRTISNGRAFYVFLHLTPNPPGLTMKFCFHLFTAFFLCPLPYMSTKFFSLTTIDCLFAIGSAKKIFPVLIHWRLRQAYINVKSKYHHPLHFSSHSEKIVWYILTASNHNNSLNVDVDCRKW